MVGFVIKPLHGIKICLNTANVFYKNQKQAYRSSLQNLLYGLSYNSCNEVRIFIGRLLHSGFKIKAQNFFHNFIVYLNHIFGSGSGFNLLLVGIKVLGPIRGFVKRVRSGKFVDCKSAVWRLRRIFLASKFIIDGAKIVYYKGHNQTFIGVLVREFVKFLQNRDSEILRQFLMYKKRVEKAQLRFKRKLIIS